MTTPEQAVKQASNLFAAVQSLRPFIHPKQLRVISTLCRGEEGAYFRTKLAEYGNRASTMPQTYDQDGLGDDAVAYLHYFTGAADWYITEKDMEGEQCQAFGLADLGYGPELGYISLVEMFSAPGPIVELDLHFSPMRVGDIKAKRAAA